MDQINPQVNQGDPKENSAGDVALEMLERLFLATGGAGAVWDALSRSAVLRCLRSGADRDSFWHKFDRDLIGGRWSAQSPTVRGAYTDPLRAETVPEVSRVAERRIGPAGPVNRVAWSLPAWANCRLGVEGVKWEAAAAAQAANFDAGFHRATGEDKTGVVRWAYDYVKTVPVLYASWVWELYIDLAGRGGAWVGGLGSVPLDRAPDGPGRAMWLAENPGGLSFPPSGVVWGGDAVGWGARRPFLRREEGAEGGARLPPYEGVRVFFVPRDAIPAAASSPLLSRSGLAGGDVPEGTSPYPEIFVSRCKSAPSLFEDVVRLASAAGRQGIFHSKSIAMVLPWLSSDQLVTLLGSVFLSWRLGMGVPLREFGAHVQATGRGGTRDLPPMACPSSDWSGALRLLANDRFRIGDTTIWEARGCQAALMGFRGDWEARVAVELGLLAIDGPSVVGPVGDDLEHSLVALGYELARWVDRSVQRTVGHGDNVSLARRGSPVYSALVTVSTLLPSLHVSGSLVSVVPVLGFSVPLGRRPAEPPDRWRFGRRAVWSRTLVGFHSDPWADFSGGSVPSSRGGLGSSALSGALGPAASFVLSRASGDVSLSGIWASFQGHPDSVQVWDVESTGETLPEAVPAPEEMIVNEFISLSVSGTSVSRLAEQSFLSPDKAVSPSASMEGLSF